MGHGAGNRGLTMSLILAGVFAAYALLGVSLWLSTEVSLATKGYWGMGVLLLTISLINVVTYRFDQQANEDRIIRSEQPRDDRLIEEVVGEAS